MGGNGAGARVGWSGVRVEVGAGCGVLARRPLWELNEIILMGVGGGCPGREGAWLGL